MQLDKDTFIKHRFWILLGLVVPILLLIIIVVPTSVGGSTETKEKEVDSIKKSLNIPEPKNTKWIEVLGEKEKKLTEKRNEVWQAAWSAQADLYTWPADPQLDYLKNAYFGDDIDRFARGRYKRERYTVKQAQDILKIIQPVQPKSERPVVLLPGNANPVVIVRDFKFEEPPSEEIWLAQEDLWVQRELLQVVRDANDSVAVFRVLPNFAAAAVVGPGVYKQVPEERYWAPASKTDKRQKFYSPNWELDLTLTGDTNKPVLRGTITNLSRRKLPLGIQFNVLVKPKRQEGDFGIASLPVDGEPVAAGKSAEIKESPSLAQAAPVGIFGVEQVFTWKTAAVKRLDSMRLYYSSHRTANATLKPARQFAHLMEAKPAEGSPGPGGDDPSNMAGGTPQIAMAGPPGGGPTGPGVQAALRTTPSGLQRDRYIHVTEQVRRMPVALTVTVEQAFIPNVIAAFSNSKLRMQVTQVHLTHVRSDSLRGPGEGTETPTTGPDDLGTGGGIPKLPVGRPPRGGEDLGPVPGGRPGLPGVGTPGFPGSGFPGGPGSSLFAAPAADEDTGNLVELTVYAIASLYERYPPRPTTTAATGEPAKPATP